MRKFMIVALALTFFAAASTAFATDEMKTSLRFGGGWLYNNKAVGGKSSGGGHAAIDFGVPGKWVVFSPMMDLYRKSGVTTTWAGANFLVRPSSEGRGSVYFGAGGGVLRTKVAGKDMNKGSFDVLAGADIEATERVSFFVEPRYVWAASKTMNGLAAHAGLAFHLK